MKQTDLASAVGISASYLNLIEHNSRRIGGKLLHDIARALAVDPAHLTEGGERGTLSALRAAASAAPELEAALAPELPRVEEFTSRFPGWATLVIAQAARMRRLEAQVAELSDRLTHDPELASSLHQMITAVTAIRSTSTILVDEPGLDRDWTDRFHRNIHDDSLRLAEAGRALVHYLDAPDGTDEATQSPQDAVARYLDALGHHIAPLETMSESIESFLNNAAKRVPGLATEAAQTLLRDWLVRYRADAWEMPLAPFGDAARAAGYDPVVMARATGLSPARVMRRLATLPIEAGHPPFGLAVCDQAGALLSVRRIPGFAPPRVGAGCPLWPLYLALSQPGRGIVCTVALPGLRETRLTAWAHAAPIAGAEFDALPAIEATMLVRPLDDSRTATEVRSVGTTCRICTRLSCSSRREPSVVGMGASGPSG